MAQKKETIFRNKKVRPALEKIPFSYWESIQQVGIAGSSDIFGCICGLFIAIEIKSTGGKTSPIQAYKQKRITAAKGIALVVYPENLEESIAYLNEVFNERKKIFKKGELRDKIKI